MLIASFAWILYVFGAFLVLTGIRMARHRDETIDIEHSVVLRLFRRVLPVTDSYHGQRFLIRQGGRWVATPLLAVLVLVEVTDIVFAVDSIPAIFAVTQQTLPGVHARTRSPSSACGRCTSCWPT